MASLPPRFAVFDAAALRAGVASVTEKRYMVLSCHPAPEVSLTTFRLIPVGTTQPVVAIHADQVPATQRGRATFLTGWPSPTESKHAWGYTRDRLHLRCQGLDEWIPVLCVHPPLPRHAPLEYKYRRIDDTEQSCLQRIQAYMHYEQELERIVPRELPKPQVESPPQSPQPLPSFVAEALVIAAKQKGDVCPITMTPFQEISKIAATPCYHLFEADALAAWLVDHATCPTCKAPVTPASITRA